MQDIVVEEAKQVVEDIGADMLGDLMGGLSPGSVAPAPKTETPPSTPEVKTETPSPAKTETPPPPPPPAPDGKLNPGDLGLPKKQGDGLPDDLIKDADIDTVFAKNEKAKNAIIKERAYNKQLREELKAAQEKLASSTVDPKIVEEAATLRAELETHRTKLKTMEDELGKMDITRSPEFRQQYTDRINQLGGRMAKAMMDEGVAQQEAVAAVNQILGETKLSSRERLVDDVAPGLKGTLLSFASQVDEVVQSRAAALENWRETAAALEETAARQRVAALTGKVDEVVRAAVDQARTLGNPYFMVTDDQEWNRDVASREQTLKGLLLSGDFSKLAPLVAEGLTASDLRSRYAVLLQSKRELETQLEQALRGTPRLGGTLPPTTPGEPKKVDFGNMPFEDALMEDLMPSK